MPEPKPPMFYVSRRYTVEGDEHVEYLNQELEWMPGFDLDELFFTNSPQAAVAVFKSPGVDLSVRPECMEYAVEAMRTY